MEGRNRDLFTQEREIEDYNQDCIAEQARIWEEEQIASRNYYRLLAKRHPRKKKRKKREDYRLKFIKQII